MGKSSNKKLNNNNNKKSSFEKKTIEYYIFYIGSNKQASDYEVTVEFILNHIKMTYQDGNDIAESLKKETKTNADAWSPTLKFSTSSDTQVALQENKKFEMIHKDELDKAMKRKKRYNNNLHEAHAEL